MPSRPRRKSPRRTASPTNPARQPGPGLVVAGDVTLDWLVHTNVDWLKGVDAPGAAPERLADAPRPRRHNWQIHRGTRMEALGGGALLLAREVGLACGSGPAGPRLIQHRIRHLRNIPPEEVLHSITELEPFPESGTDAGRGPLVYRVARFHGFSGPLDGLPPPLPVPDDDPDAAVVILDDAGNAFRDQEQVWPLAVRTRGRKPVVVMKMSRPLSGGPLFDRVRLAHADRLVLVVNADDLRAEGVNISRRLSWERTAREFVWQMRHNPELQVFRDLPSLVVRLGLDGAIHYTGGPGRAVARLYYDPAGSEDGFRERHQGGMIGLTDVFIAALVARVVREGLDGVGEGIRDGIRSARRFFRAGFGADPRRLDYPGAEVFGPAQAGDEPIADAMIPQASTRDSADPEFWCLLNELEGAGLERLARRLVVTGEASALRHVPVGEFGGLRTVDRAEIESFRSIQNLIRQFLVRRETRRPLCLAVFGPPGSGKSFGVEQVAGSVGRVTRARVAKLEFNLSQFESTRDLVAALHLVRDEVLRGSVPLVFFDEFDCAFHGPLGWLRYFLAPMQDGLFKDGEGMHPVGKAIFVFAGGLNRTFAHFNRDVFEADVPEPDVVRERRAFREAKGPDFVSRLRGYVNILGPNPDPDKPADRLYLVRRATILRSLLRRNWASLIRAEDPSRLNLDEAVLRALVGVPEYRHGIRSMEAVLEMSLIEGRPVFEPSALPPLHQLEQHVDAEAFSRLVLQGVLFTAARDAIAEAIHEKHRRDRKGDKPADDPSMQPWAELAEPFRRSNRAQADDILRKLEHVGCGYRPRRGGKPPGFRFSREEIELLAELEHDRFVRERLDDGWTLGPRKDLARRTDPTLVPWADLGDRIRQYDRDTVAGIPEFMAAAGFEVYRL
jgi:hypothetical protein